MEKLWKRRNEGDEENVGTRKMEKLGKRRNKRDGEIRGNEGGREGGGET